jgi:predicted ATP-dependent serine protease
LGGEVRNIGKLKERLAEAEKLGVTKAFVPDVNISVGKIAITKIKNLSEIIKQIS